MKKEEIRILILAVVLLLPAVGLICNNVVIAILSVIYLSSLFTAKKFWMKVYKSSMKLENLIIN